MKAERKILLKLLDLLHEIEILEVNISGENRVQLMHAIPYPSRLRRLRSKKEKKETQYSTLLTGLNHLKQVQ